MKHFYNLESTISCARPALKAVGVVLSGRTRLFSLLLLVLFLQLGTAAYSQVVPLYGPNAFDSSAGLSIQGISRGGIGVSGGQLQALTVNGNEPGYSGYVVISSHPLTLRAGYTYTVSFQARANNQNAAASGNIEVLQGSSIVEAGSASGTAKGSVAVNKNSELSGYAITFTAPNTENNQYIALRLFSQANENNSHLYLDNLSIIESCEPPAPQVVPASSCSAATFTLTVAGNTAGASYRWYTADGTLINGQNKSTLETGQISISTTYYVSRVNGNCESDRTPVTVLVGNVHAPVVATTEDCPSGNVTLVASGAAPGDTYVWYDASGAVVSGAVAVGTTSRLERKRANQSGGYTVEIVKSAAAGGCRSLPTPVHVMHQGETVGTPGVAPAGRCGAGAVTLSATGAIPGEDYLWYTSLTGGTAIHRGASYTTSTLPEGTTYFYVSKVNNALGCESVTRATVPVTVTPSVQAAGSIIEPSGMEAGKSATFTFTSNIPAAEIEAYQWHYQITGSTDWVQGANTPAYTIQSMPGNIDALRLDLTIREQYYSCYSNVIAPNRIYRITNTSIVPLPVELISFKAQRHAQGVQLTWATASEQDNRGFEVQVSTDARAFQNLGFVRSEVGTTSMAQRYSFLDTRAVSGTRYYRLAQVDLDGTTTLSSVQAVSLDGGNGVVAAYPNPFEEVVTVKLNGTEPRKVKATVMNVHGQLIADQLIETSGNTVTVNTAHVTQKGIYFLHVVDSDGTKHTFKLMKN